MIGCFAQTFPGKPVYLIAFCALRVRCILYTLSDNPIWLVAVQILDGVGAGVFGIMQTLVVADLTKATGRFNLAQGAIAMAVGIGASSSNLLGGKVVQWAGYRAGFVRCRDFGRMVSGYRSPSRSHTGSIPKERHSRRLARIMINSRVKR
jgi:MFS family permease